jgi:UDP-N-acetylmuramate dehydrogenase
MIQENIPLAKFTTFGIGGLADYFIDISSEEELLEAVRFAHEKNISITMLGGGSNVLISDQGIRGLVIKNTISGFEVLEKTSISQIKKSDAPRKEESLSQKNALDWRDLLYTEEATEFINIKVKAGTNLGYLINKTIDQGFTGLQWFARIPGTVGGAIWNNIHGADKLFGDYVTSVRFIDKKTGEIEILKHEDLGFGYNKSIFHDDTKIIVEADLNLFLGNKEKAKETMNEWIKRKSMQPYNSPGCTFSNLSEEDKRKYNLENLSAAFIIDKLLDLKGTRIGNAQISENHANFIVNLGGASANDVMKLIKLINEKCQEKLGFELKNEIKFLGDFS